MVEKADYCRLKLSLSHLKSVHLITPCYVFTFSFFNLVGVTLEHMTLKARLHETVIQPQLDLVIVFHIIWQSVTSVTVSQPLCRCVPALSSTGVYLISSGFGAVCNCLCDALSKNCSPQSWSLEHLIPSWQCGLGRFKWYSLYPWGVGGIGGCFEIKMPCQPSSSLFTLVCACG